MDRPGAGHHRYRELDRAGTGLVRLCAERVTGLSRAPVARIAGLHVRGEPVKPADLGVDLNE
jgi:hypothetical protein